MNTPTENNSEIGISYKAASKLTGINIGTLYSMVCNKRIPHIRLGKRHVVFNKDELIAWLLSQKVEIQAEPSIKSW